MSSSRKTKKDYLLQAFLIMAQSEHLHLGYCDDPDAVFESYKELRDAQENYLQLCLKSIPENANTVLDIGCGTGEMIYRLSNKGLKVDGLIPDELLIQKIKEKVPGTEVILSRFEHLENHNKKYDLLLFMESFGYIKDMDKCLSNCLSLLNPGGHILITDFFSKDKMVEGKKDVYNKNFHSLAEFKEKFASHPELETVTHLDMTPNTVPTMRFTYKMCTEYFKPLIEVFVNSSLDSLTRKRPFLFKIIDKLFGKNTRAKYEKRSKQLKQLDPDYYKEACSYDLFLFKKK
jgi:SAM-dependent methyltransferase